MSNACGSSAGASREIVTRRTVLSATVYSESTGQLPNEDSVCLPFPALAGGLGVAGGRSWPMIARTEDRNRERNLNR